MFESLRTLFFFSRINSTIGTQRLRERDRERDGASGSEKKNRRGKKPRDNQLHTRFIIQKVTGQLDNSFDVYIFPGMTPFIFRISRRKKKKSIFAFGLLLSRHRVFFFASFSNETQKWNSCVRHLFEYLSNLSKG